MLDFLLENKYIYAVITIFVMLYAAQIGPKLPDYMVRLFENNLFKMLFLFLIVVRANKDPAFSVILAIAFVIITNYARTQLLNETFAEESVIVEQDGVLTLNPEKCNEARLELNNLDIKINDLATTCNNKIEDIELKKNCFKTAEKMMNQRTKYNELIQKTCIINQPIII